MNPLEIYDALEKDTFPHFHRGDIILTNHLGNFFSTLIRIAGVIKGETPHRSHAEKYLTSGLCIGADKHGVTIKPFRKFFDGKYDVSVYSNTTLTKEQRDCLLKSALWWHGKYYDVVGILWQALDTIFFTDWFSRKFNSVKLPYCSELIERIYIKLPTPESPLHQGIKVSYKPLGTSIPNDIYEYVEHEKDWECVFKMEKVAGNWRVEQ